MEIISAICEVFPQLRVANLYIKLSSTDKILSTASVLDNSVCFEAIEDEALKKKIYYNAEFTSCLIQAVLQKRFSNG